MNVIKIVIPSSPRTKKNSQRILYKYVNGKKVPFIAPSSYYEDFEKICWKYVQEYSDLMINYPINLKCVFYMESRRKVDLCNLQEAICDILSKYHIIADDNRNIVASHDGSRVYYDKTNPRIEIEITKLADPDYEQWTSSKKKDEN